MSEDLIKRSDAIEVLRKLGHEVVVIDKVCSLGVAGEFIDAIRTIPSADRPQGEWIYHKEILLDEEYYPSRFECDQCHHYVIAGNDRNFCPNCGAKMKGADNE